MAYEPGSASDEEVERNRQWEFRLAQASVMATDHDLSDDLRSIAYLASAVPNGTDEDKQAFLDAAASVRDRCE